MEVVRLAPEYDILVAIGSHLDIRWARQQFGDMDATEEKLRNEGYLFGDEGVKAVLEVSFRNYNRKIILLVLEKKLYFKK